MPSTLIKKDGNQPAGPRVRADLINQSNQRILAHLIRMAEEEDDTDTKLAILSSIFTGTSQETLLELLIKADGNVEAAINTQLSLEQHKSRPPLSPPIAKRQKLSSTPTTSTPLSPSNRSLNTPQKSLGSILKWAPSAEPPRRVHPAFPGWD